MICINHANSVLTVTADPTMFEDADVEDGNHVFFCTQPEIVFQTQFVTNEFDNRSITQLTTLYTSTSKKKQKRLLENYDTSNE